MSDWVLVRVKTGQENWARLNCEKQGMRTYYPRCQVPGKGKLVPVFPAYIFVQPGDMWRYLRSTYGVVNIIMRGDRPEYVPKAVMKELRSHEDDEGIFVLPRQAKPHVGETVEIKKGAWKNHLAIYDGQTPEGRTRVLLEFMGRVVTLELKRLLDIEVLHGSHGSDSTIQKDRRVR